MNSWKRFTPEALALLAASEAEGFGLPLIEASFMACRFWRVTFLSLGRLLETRRLILLLVTIGLGDRDPEMAGSGR